MSKKPLIYGGGGGGTPDTAPNNLFSKDTAEILIGLCEGPIEGLENGEKSFYLDDTPLESTDGTKNYTNYTLDIKKGDVIDDESIKFQLGGSGRSTSVGIELKQNTPVTRVTQTGEIDYIDVRITVQQLYMAYEDGDVLETSTSFNIEYKRQDESEWTLFQNKAQTITGKTTTGYVRDYRIPVERSSEYYYEVRITKLTEDTPQASSYGRFNTVSWYNFEEIVAGTGNYPNTAIAHLVIESSDQLNNMPQLSGVYKFLKIRIPSNYNPTTRVYAGEWDGTFKIAWTDNPAWCLYDLIMNDRYGVNAYYPVECDKWDFYEAGQYCDELVPDGKGGMEPRYTLNIVLEESQSGPDMLNYIAGIFNATIYEDASGLVRLAFQREQQATHIFSLENVTPAGFVYNFSDPSTRYNDLSVSFMNSERDWIEDRRRVFDEESVKEWGRITEDFVAVGCIKESEAMRRARYRLLTNITETMSVTFTTNISAGNVNMFDTILIADKTMGYSTSGRFKDIAEDGLSATLRDSIFLEAGVAYTIHVQTANGLLSVALNVVEVGYVKELHFADSIANLGVPEKAVFSLVGSSGVGGSPKPFRVVSISESPDGNGSYSITAIEINRDKQQKADLAVVMEDEIYTKLPSYSIIPQVKDVKFTQTFITSSKQMHTIVDAVLDKEHYPYYTGTYKVYSRLQGEETWLEREVFYGDTLIDHPMGTYEFKILPKTTFGKVPNFENAPVFVYKIEDLSKPPADVQNFRAEANINNIVFKWDEVPDADLIGYEIRKGEVWEEGEVIVTYTVGTEYVYTGIVTENTYFTIKAIDVLGNYSENYPTVSVQLAKPQNVTSFFVTPNLDSLRFDWVAPAENGVEYEVRIGESWDSGIKLFKVSGFNQTVLNPSYGDAGFMIRSVSKAGVYSSAYRYAEARLELHQNRNVILELDNVKDGWNGSTSNLEPTEFEDILAMKEGVYFAEHYFEVNLPELTRARNWYETEGFKFGTRLTFEDLKYTWASEEAAGQNWLNSTSIGSSMGEIQPMITYEMPSEYLSYLGFRLNGTLEDVRGEVNPTVSENVNYGSGRYTLGLMAHRMMKVENGVEVPEEFTLKFRFKVHKYVSWRIPLVRLSGANGSILVYLYSQNEIIVKRSDGVEIVCPITYFGDGDFVSVVLTQSADKLKLDYFVEYAKLSGKGEVNARPLGEFTNLRFGGKYE